MKYIVLLVAVLVSGCATMWSPTGYIEKKECDISARLSLKPECKGGYSSTTISRNKVMVTFEGNGRTSLQRATDLSILRCADLALLSKSPYISIKIIERKLVTSISTSDDGKTTSSNYPIASIHCNLSTISSDTYIDAKGLSEELKLKYNVL